MVSYQMRMRFGIYIKAAGTAAVRIATVPVALFICGFGIRGPRERISRGALPEPKEKIGRDGCPTSVTPQL